MPAGQVRNQNDDGTSLLSLSSKLSRWIRETQINQELASKKVRQKQHFRKKNLLSIEVTHLNTLLKLKALVIYLRFRLFFKIHPMKEIARLLRQKQLTKM